MGKRPKTLKMKPLPQQQVVVGLVKKFEVHDENFKEALSGHPFEGRVYRLIHDFDPQAPTNGYYRLHIGRDKTAGLDGLLLGNSLVGEIPDKWTFEIVEITKENFLDFTLEGDDITTVKGWFDSNHADLVEVLGLQTIATTSMVPSMDPDVIEETELMEAVEKMAEKEFEIQEAFNKLSDSLNMIVNTDREFAKVIADTVNYLATCYGDKYEDKNTPNISKMMLLGSPSPDTALFNVFKYLQRYRTTGYEKSANPKDIYKSIHYLLFELQRASRKNA